MSVKPKLTDHQREYIAALRKSNLSDVIMNAVGFTTKCVYLMDNKDQRK